MLTLFTEFQNAIYVARNQPEQPIGTLAKQLENEIGHGSKSTVFSGHLA
jgi:hypothetical protein